MEGTIKVAGVQMDCALGDVARNLAYCVEQAGAAAQAGAQLVIFPECALTGYIHESVEEMVAVAETVPGPSLGVLMDRCREADLHMVVGLVEREGDVFYNTSALLGPSGLIGKYRKLHLPFVGVDRFVRPGNLAPQVHDTALGKIGLCICYDLDFPELSRVMALAGAEMVVAIANWPEGIEFVPEYLLRTRARENMVYHLAVNRVGEERGTRFIGRSKFCDCLGDPLAEAGPVDPQMILADIRPAWAHEKRKVYEPGVRENDLMADRRPEFYGLLCAQAE